MTAPTELEQIAENIRKAQAQLAKASPSLEQIAENIRVATRQLGKSINAAGFSFSDFKEATDSIEDYYCPEHGNIPEAETYEKASPVAEISGSPPSITKESLDRNCSQCNGLVQYVGPAEGLDKIPALDESEELRPGEKIINLEFGDEQVDWKALLIKYVGHVMDCESVSFINEGQTCNYGYPLLLKEEREILERLEVKIEEQREAS